MDNTSLPGYPHKAHPINDHGVCNYEKQHGNDNTEDSKRQTIINTALGNKEPEMDQFPWDPLELVLLGNSSNKGLQTTTLKKRIEVKRRMKRRKWR